MRQKLWHGTHTALVLLGFRKASRAWLQNLILYSVSFAMLVAYSIVVWTQNVDVPNAPRSAGIFASATLVYLDVIIYLYSRAGLAADHPVPSLILMAGCRVALVLIAGVTYLLLVHALVVLVLGTWVGCSVAARLIEGSSALERVVAKSAKHKTHRNLGAASGKPAVELPPFAAMAGPSSRIDGAVGTPRFDDDAAMPATPTTPGRESAADVPPDLTAARSASDPARLPSPPPSPPSDSGFVDVTPSSSSASGAPKPPAKKGSVGFAGVDQVQIVQIGGTVPTAPALTASMGSEEPADKRGSLELLSRRAEIPLAVLVVSFVVEVALAGAFAPDANCVDTVVPEDGSLTAGEPVFGCKVKWFEAGSTHSQYLFLLCAGLFALFLTLATAVCLQLVKANWELKSVRFLAPVTELCAVGSGVLIFSLNSSYMVLMATIFVPGALFFALHATHLWRQASAAPPSRPPPPAPPPLPTPSPPLTAPSSPRRRAPPCSPTMCARRASSYSSSLSSRSASSGGRWAWR